MLGVQAMTLGARGEQQKASATAHLNAVLSAMPAEFVSPAVQACAAAVQAHMPLAVQQA